MKGRVGKGSKGKGREGKGNSTILLGGLTSLTNPLKVFSAWDCYTNKRWKLSEQILNVCQRNSKLKERDSRLNIVFLQTNSTMPGATDHYIEKC